jgi:hypothetical protein
VHFSSSGRQQTETGNINIHSNSIHQTADTTKESLIKLCLHLHIESLIITIQFYGLFIHRYNNILFLVFCQLIITQNNMRISNNILEHPALISFVRLVQTSGQFHSIQSYLDN